MEITSIRLVISQPSTRKTPSEWDCTPEWLEKDTKRTQERAYHAMQVWKIEKPAAYEHHQRPGEKQCAYCKAKTDCVKYKQLVSETVFMNKDALDGFGVEPGTECAPVYMPTDINLLASYYLRIPLIKSWCDAIEKKVFEKVKTGEIGEAQGLKMVAGKAGKRNWLNAEQAEELLKSFKLRKDEMYSFNLISPAQAEKVLAENPRQWNKLKAVITQAEGGPSIVHVSDRRPPINLAPSAAGMEVEEEPAQESPPPVSDPAPADIGDDLC